MDHELTGRARSGELGFIALVGVVMGGVLALGTWKMVHVATALGEREQLTNAADAMALDNAVWHAQGMNLLVYMNAAMAIVLSVFLALRVLELLLIAVGVLAAIFAPAALTAIGNGLMRVVNLERKVGPKIMRILHVVNMAERVVASAVPALPGAVNRAELVGNVATKGGASGSIDVGSLEDYYEKTGVIRQGVPLGLSMIPTLVDRKIPGFPPRMGNLDGQVHSSKVLKGIKLAIGNPSLPVEEEDYYQVCSRSAEFMTAGFTGMLARTGIIPDQVARLVASRVSQVVGTLPALACEPFDASTLQRELEESIGTACKAEKDEQESGENARAWSRSDQKKCEKKHREKAKESFKKQSAQPNPDMIKTAKLWNITSHVSSAFLHTWAVAVAQPNSFKAEGTLKGWILWLSGDKEDSNDKITLGEAEFFFQCRKQASHRTCGDDAMWRPWWTASTVRVNAPWKEIDLLSVAYGWGNNALGNLLSDALKKVLVSSFRGKHAADNAKDSGWHIFSFLFGKGNGSNYVTRYTLPQYAQDQVEAGRQAYTPLVKDLLIH
jgi:hypothetical protein